MPSEFMTVALHGLRFRCAVDRRPGAGDRPWLVFSNSLLTDLSLWDDQVAAFADRYDILRYDQRGHGGSEVPPGDCTFDALADDLAGLMAHFGIGAAVIVGVSMGGATALRLLARHPERAVGAAICDAGAATPPGGREAWEERIALAQTGGMAALVEPTIKRWFTPDQIESEAAGRVRPMIAGTPLEGFVRATRALQDYDLRPDLPNLRVPVLTLAGSEDGATPAAMRDYSARIPQAAFVVIEGAGHLPNIERPDAFNDHLGAYFGRLAHGRPS